MVITRSKSKAQYNKNNKDEIITEAQNDKYITEDITEAGAQKDISEAQEVQNNNDHYKILECEIERINKFIRLDISNVCTVRYLYTQLL